METEEFLSRRNAPYSEFAFAVVKAYICYLFFFTLILVISVNPDFTIRVLIVLFSGTPAWLNNTFSLSKRISQKYCYGFRGWSKIQVDTQPKIVLAILCWPIFTIWLLSWPGIKIYQRVKNQRANIPNQQWLGFYLPKNHHFQVVFLFACLVASEVSKGLVSLGHLVGILFFLNGITFVIGCS